MYCGKVHLHAALKIERQSKRNDPFSFLQKRSRYSKRVCKMYFQRIFHSPSNGKYPEIKYVSKELNKGCLCNITKLFTRVFINTLIYSINKYIYAYTHTHSHTHTHTYIY